MRARKMTDQTINRMGVLLLLSGLFAGAASNGEDRLLLSDQLVGRELTYIAQPGDSLTAIGARFGVGINIVTAANNLPPNARLKVAQELNIDNRHIVPRATDDGIVINIPQRMLFLFKEGQARRAYPVALGKPDWPTPSGRFRIAVKEENPVWDVPKSIQEEMRREGKEVKTCVPPGPDNPLGQHWLGLSISGYGIHGTIAPSSIYQFQTHGCIRLHPNDVAELFPAVERGTPVLLIYRRLLIASIGGRLFLEVHRDIYGKQPSIEAELKQLAESKILASRIDWSRAGDIIRRQDGIARDVTQYDAAGLDNETLRTPSRSLPPRP
jgi:L,D-transpeptidase ErfK/SrfK